MVRCLSNMWEVLGLNPVEGNNFCSPCPLKKTKKQVPNTPIPMMHTLICEELKDPSILLKAVP